MIVQTTSVSWKETESVTSAGGHCSNEQRKRRKQTKISTCSTALISKKTDKRSIYKTSNTN